MCTVTPVVLTPSYCHVGVFPFVENVGSCPDIRIAYISEIWKFLLAIEKDFKENTPACYVVHFFLPYEVWDEPGTA